MSATTRMTQHMTGTSEVHFRLLLDFGSRSAFRRPHWHPRVFMAHGTRDHILPIYRCGRRIAAKLKADGCSVEFETFDSDHEIRPEMVQRSMDWFTRTTF
jgi:predicted esterase